MSSSRTLTGTSSTPRSVATTLLGSTLGRYRIDRVLGTGAMGVVYAAFDPDLERWIALKVLPDATATRTASERLLREARAMARLAHPNVITVHEVGTADGRDFVAMDMVEGETLADWLRARRRPIGTIMEAFIAAGAGLAAAHAAGIVHRDFKPHNVLRYRDGRIVVTDFGLAREADDALPVSDAELEPDPVSLTSTGAMLGTPAYMAPEQWHCSTLTPACDQFAYCVSLWEALAGERPFRGATLDELRGRILSGPDALDASRIPRRLRIMLRRGLDPDPARRWPDMKTLLAQLTRDRGPGYIAVALASVMVIVALVVALLAALRDAQRDAVCEPADRDAAEVWSPEIANELRAATSDAHAVVLDVAAWRWRAARTGACRMPAPLRRTQLDCLDGVLARFDALRQAFLRAPGIEAEELAAQLVDPKLCRKPVASEVPHLTLKPTPDLVAALARYARSHARPLPSDQEFAAAVAVPADDRCIRAINALAFAEVSQDLSRVRDVLVDAKESAVECRDERLRSDVYIAFIPYQRETAGGQHMTDAISDAESAARRVTQPDVAAALAIHRVGLERQEHHWDEALRLADVAVASYASCDLPVRALRAIIARNAMRLVRAEPGDLAAVDADAAEWRPVASTQQRAELARQLDIEAAVAQFRRGDVAAAHVKLISLWQHQPPGLRAVQTRRIIGRVIDRDGRPVAGAELAAGRYVTADTAGIGVPAGLFDEALRDTDELRLARSDVDGRFELEVAAGTGVIVAQHGALRSPPVPIAEHVSLVLGPTRTVTGKVDLGGVAATRVSIYAALDDDRTHRFKLVAPPAADGSFSLAGAPVGAFRIGAAIRGNDNEIAPTQYLAVPASPDAVSVHLDVARSARTIDVIVRSTVTTPLDSATVVMLRGQHRIKTFRDINRVPLTERQGGPATAAGRRPLPPVLQARLRPGDLVAHFDNVGSGEWTVCASSVTIDLQEPTSLVPWRDRHPSPTLGCKAVGPDDKTVELSIPLQRRLD